MWPFEEEEAESIIDRRAVSDMYAAARMRLIDRSARAEEVQNRKRAVFCLHGGAHRIIRENQRVAEIIMSAVKKRGSALPASLASAREYRIYFKAESEISPD